VNRHDHGTGGVARSGENMVTAPTALDGKSSALKGANNSSAAYLR
jgi:hypothetical protein